MARKAPPVNFDITADDKTRRAFNSVNRSMSNFARRATSLKSAVSGLLIVGAATALVRFAKSAVEAADDIAKTAKSIGITGEELQELRFAAELAGVETAEFDKGLQTFVRLVGQAQVGTGALVTELNKYDPALLNTLKQTETASEAFEIYMEAIARAPNEFGRAQLAQAAYGRAGKRMAVLALEGADGIRRAREEARELGIVIDNRTLASAEELNDQFTRMTRVFGVNFQRVMLSLAPTVVSIGMAASRATGSIAQMIEDLSIPEDQQSFDVLARKLESAKTFLAELEATEPNAFDEFFGFDEDRLRRARERVSALEELAVGAARRQQEFERLIQSAGGPVQDPFQKFTDLVAAQNAKLAENRDALFRTAGEQAKFQVLQKALNAAKAEGIELSDREVEQLAMLADQARAYTEEIEKIKAGQEAQKKSAEEAKNVARELGLTMESAFEDAVIAGERFSVVLASLAEDLARVALRRSVTEPIFSGLSGFISDLVPGFATGGSFRVGGAGPTDSKLVAFRATPGERVDISRPGQNRRIGVGGGGSATVINNVTVNVAGGSRGAGADRDMAARLGREVTRSLRGLVTQEIRLQMRPGNLLGAGV